MNAYNNPYIYISISYSCYVYIYITNQLRMTLIHPYTYAYGPRSIFGIKSSIFEKYVLSFFRFLYISKCHRFLQSVLSFSKPQLQVNFQKIKISRILLSINLNFGCSSYIDTYIYIYIGMTEPVYIYI